MTEAEAIQTFLKLMYQDFLGRLEKLKTTGRKIVHYTSAENAINILNSKTIWLRNAALMNDYMEIHYGKKQLINSLERYISEINSILDKHHTGLMNDILIQLLEVHLSTDTHTYFTSFAEHPTDDELGKLSMWRAYGGPVAGVAIVFNSEVFEDGKLQKLSTAFRPVIYGPREFEDRFEHLMFTLKENQDLISLIPRQISHSILFHVFNDLTLITKHPGFQEEDEWRIIHSPHLFSSTFVTDSIHTIRGIPQTIYKIELRKQPGLDVPELELNNLIHRVIIGPCQYPRQVADAIATALDRAHVKEPYNRIAISDIPLRQQG